MEAACRKNDPVLNAQRKHWENVYSEEPDFFGEEPSYAAKKALEVFKAESVSKILELGAGQGRDAQFFASQGFKVTAIDYSETAVNAIKEKGEQARSNEANRRSESRCEKTSPLY